MSDGLASSIPPQWVTDLRPFLQRADEFQERQPVVSYFLRMHVACLASKKRRADDRDETQFFKKLLNSLEGEKRRLGAEVTGADGRTVLTRYALMLFAKADDEERSGKADMNVVRLFFTASILFDATGQFMDGGKLDPIAEEKRTYARYIAVCMKKALDRGVPYESPNTIEAPIALDESEEGPKGDGATAPTLSTQPPSSFLPRLQPPPLQQQQQQPFMAPSAPPPSAPPSAPPSYSQHMMASPTQPQQQPSYAPPRQPSPRASLAEVQPRPAPTALSLDAVMNAQKFAKQAVSALQFNDIPNARKQLQSALNALDGK